MTDGEGPDGKDPERNGKGHQVFKFSPDGKVLMTLGKPGIAGDGPDTFNQPSAVLVAPKGDIFIGDGHGGNSNARVLKFSKDGKFLYLADHQSDQTTNPGFRKGITIGSAKNGKVMAFIPDLAGSQEGVAADAKGNVYGSLTGGMALKKYVKQ
ncbi:MAG: hypothetical protein HY646_02395 [Acidobacteria bacterium]|nr:hypothetical protein [Acidobacteriota bacterium]